MGFDILETQILGESHSDEMRLNFFGLPREGFAGDSIVNMLERRKASRSPWSTPRIEDDRAVFTNGLKETADGEIAVEKGKIYTIDGDVLCAYVKNSNVKKGDYDDILSIPRPSHADYVQFLREGKIASGGGRFSGRLTTMFCIAGGIAEDILRRRGIEIVAYISSVGEKKLGTYNDGADLNGFDKKLIDELKSDNFPVLAKDKKQDAIDYIKTVANAGDSVGGTIECLVLGVGAGALGDNLLSGLEGKIAYSVFCVPAVKGVEFGSGFELARMKGSQANDALCIDYRGSIKTKTNHSGGINGGISNGMPIALRVAVKPTPSIAVPQQSIDLSKKSPCVLNVKGRHDACIVPRAVAPVESAVALAILDEVLLQEIAKQTV